MKPASIHQLLPSRQTQGQARNVKSGLSPDSFASTLSRTINGRQAAADTSARSPSGQTDRQSENLKRQEQDLPQDTLKRNDHDDHKDDDLSGYAYTQPDPTAIENQSVSQNAGLDVNAPVILTDSGKETLVFAKDLAAKNQTTADEENDQPISVFRQLPASQKVAASESGSFNHTIKKPVTEPLSDSAFALSAAADLETASARNSDLAEAGLDREALTAAKLDLTLSGQNLEQSQINGLFAADGEKDQAGIVLSNSDLAALSGTNLGNLLSRSSSAADNSGLNAALQASGDPSENALNIAKNSQSAAASGIFSGLPGSDLDAVGKNTLFGPDQITDNHDDSQLQASAAGQTAQLNLTGALIQNGIIGGLEAAQAIDGSDSHQPRLPEQVVASLFLMERGGQQSLRVRLFPDQLGELQINLIRNTDGLTARLTADTLASCRLLEANLPQLQQALAEKEIICRQIDVQYQPPGFQQAGGDQNQQSDTDDPGWQSHASTQAQSVTDSEREAAEKPAGNLSGKSQVTSPYQLDHLI